MRVPPDGRPTPHERALTLIEAALIDRADVDPEDYVADASSHVLAALAGAHLLIPDTRTETPRG